MKTHLLMFLEESKVYVPNSFRFGVTIILVSSKSKTEAVHNKLIVDNLFLSAKQGKYLSSPRG